MFSVLGPLEVRVHDRIIPITAPKQRIVLAALLLDVNAPVSIQRLMALAWDGRPPAAAHTCLQSYIYRLRQRLCSAGGVKLATCPDGYMLQCAPEKIDVTRFRERFAAAQKMVGNDVEGAAEGFREALSFWRGKALYGVPGELIQHEARFLESEQTAAYEQLYDAEIERGNHRGIIPELQRLVSENPFHERFLAQLMLALYRSGRQVESLRHYVTFQRQLRELGLEPGQILRELQMAILDQQPSAEIMLSS